MRIGRRSSRAQRILRTPRTALVRVPASTSNLGPGFDCLGVALRLYNDVRVSRAARGQNDAMVASAGEVFFDRAGIEPFAFRCSIRGEVPRSRGLGSSVTVRLGVLHGLNVIAGQPFARDELFGMCAELEGHPDNAAPASYGGFTVAHGNSVQRFVVSARLKFVLLVPAHEMATVEARGVLPREIARGAAVRSVGNACAITAAFASGEYEKLPGIFADELHQPFREVLNPGMREVIAAGERAGALGGFLSGSGSTIACVTLRNSAAVANAMQRKNGRVIVTTADNRGVQILKQ